jgi:hypothetical protein
MPISQVDIFGDENANFMDLPVSINGDTLVIGQGPIKIFGVAYILEEGGEFTLSPSAELRRIGGYLAEITATPGYAAILVDEVFAQDSAYDFNTGPYKSLTPLFQIQAPPGKTLSELDVRVYRFIQAPPPPSPTPSEEGQRG